eukprot:2834259-Karenia_brevis.AAC.1
MSSEKNVCYAWRGWHRKQMDPCCRGRFWKRCRASLWFFTRDAAPDCTVCQRLWDDHHFTKAGVTEVFNERIANALHTLEYPEGGGNHHH